jgi:hypothetical protein
MAALTHGDRLRLRNSNHAFDPAYNTTDHTADDAANHGADWTGRALTHGDALLAPAYNALGLGRERCRNSGNNDSSHRELRLHEQAPLLMFAPSANDAEILVSALWHHREANVAANQQNRSSASGTTARRFPIFRSGGRGSSPTILDIMGLMQPLRLSPLSAINLHRPAGVPNTAVR